MFEQLSKEELHSRMVCREKKPDELKKNSAAFKKNKAINKKMYGIKQKGEV